MPISKLDPVMMSQVEMAIDDLEIALLRLQMAITGLHTAFVRIYPPDESEAWYLTWNAGRLGQLWDRLERLNVQEIIEVALG
jgi:hypothetical protein